MSIFDSMRQRAGRLFGSQSRQEPGGADNSPTMPPHLEPRVKAWQEFGRLAGQLHSANSLGSLHIDNCSFLEDGTLQGMFSPGHDARILERGLTRQERVANVATVGKNLSNFEHWNAFKRGYHSAISQDTEAVLAHAEPLVAREMLGHLEPTKEDKGWLASMESGMRHLEQGDFPEAEKELARAVKLCEHFVPFDPRRTAALQRLSDACYRQGKYAEVQALQGRILNIKEQTLDEDDPELTEPLSELAMARRVQGDYAGAEELNRKALAILERRESPDGVALGSILNNLASCCQLQNRPAEAEPLYQRAIELLRAAQPRGVNTANAMRGLANALVGQERWAEARALYVEALDIHEQHYGPDHPELAHSLNNVALVQEKLGEPQAAEESLRRALSIRERALGPDHELTGLAAANLGSVLGDHGAYAESEALHERALHVFARRFGPQNPQTQMSLQDYVSAIRRSGRPEEAERVLAHWRGIQNN